MVFVKEIVPKPTLTFVANTVYKEHYETMKMDHSWTEAEDKREVRYSWSSKGIMHSFGVTAERDSKELIPNSETAFITEHYWGYTKASEHSSFEYEVTHPTWQAYEVLSHEIKVDFGAVYGPSFEFLNQLQPRSVMLAEGSEITVENKRKI